MPLAMDRRSAGPLWATVLLPPFAWAAALSLLYAMTNPACLTQSRAVLIAVGLVCIGVAAAAGPLALWLAPHEDEPTETAANRRFLARLALWNSALFVLIIVMSVVPVFLLDACSTSVPR